MNEETSMPSILRTLLAATAMLAAGHATAGNGPDGYPERPVTLVVPFSPGGGSDNIARFIATRLAERIDGTVIVDNRPGAGTNIGNQIVARSNPDGQTLLFGQVTLSINPHVYQKLQYDIEKDFVHVAHIANSPTILLTNPGMGFKDLAGFTDYARRNPGEVNYGSGGTGTSVHLAGHLFGSIAGLDMTHIPYRGSGPAIIDLIGGEIQAIFDTAPSAVPQIAGGKVRPLAVSGPARLQNLPDVPTFSEAGYAEFDAPAWYGILAPTGTPPAIIEYLNEQVNQILDEPETHARLAQLGSVTAHSSPAEFGEFMRKESSRWRAVVKSANVSAD